MKGGGIPAAFAPRMGAVVRAGISPSVAGGRMLEPAGEGSARR